MAALSAGRASKIMKFDYEAFDKWEQETHIPEKILTMANAIAKEYFKANKITENVYLALVNYKS